MGEKVVLAYSGGLDTAVICKWLAEKGYDVIAFVAEVGQSDDYSGLEAKALGCGAVKFVRRDLREEFVRDFVFPGIRFNAAYEGRYLLGTSYARPLIAREMVRVAREEGARILAHGATGKGNDQVRFELTAYALMPDVKIIAPWRDAEFTRLIKGRKEAIEYVRKHNIPVKASLHSIWSCDENLMHLSFEGGPLEDPWHKPDAGMFERSVSPQDAPDKTVTVEIEFEKGLPVGLDGRRLGPLEIFNAVNRLASENGIGRIDIVESRFVGMKSRGVYETPGGTLLIAAHRDIESFCCDKDVIQLKDRLMPRFAKLVYDGFWFSHEMECLLALLEESQRFVNGVVRLDLYKGNPIVTGRRSATSLYDAQVASMEDDAGAYDQSDATGFIRLNALSLRMHAKRRDAK